MNNHQLTTLWLGSLRYYIGRRTAGVSDFTNLLIQEWSNLPPETQNFIERDLEEVFNRDDSIRYAAKRYGCLPLGDDCDRTDWDKVRRLWNDTRRNRRN